MIPFKFKPFLIELDYSDRIALLFAIVYGIA